MSKPTTQIKIQAPNPPEPLLRAIERKALHYTDPAYLYFCIWLGGDNFCGTFGDGPNGAYEWFVWYAGELETSDVGYGSNEEPLRVVLNKLAERC